MDYQQLLTRLKEILQQRLPEGQNHARQLSEILGVKPHSVYRKLSGEIQFSVDDLVKISGALSIPLGTLLDDYSCVVSHPMELILMDNMAKEKGYTSAMETTQAIFGQAGKTGNAKFMAICKNLPVISYYYYDWLMKFAHLKWLYFNNGCSVMPSLSETVCPDPFMKAKDIYVESFNSIRRLIFVVDGDLVRNFTMDLDFFRKMGFVTAAEMLLVLEDMRSLLMEIQSICQTGLSYVSGQEIQVFYSDIPLYNDIYLIESSTINRGIFYAQGFNPIIHREPQTLEIFRKWVNAWVSCSNPICGTSEPDCRTFFKKQHRIIEEYRNSLAWVEFFGSRQRGRK